MHNSDKKTREPLFHIVKRDRISLSKSLLIRVVATVSAMLLCTLLAYVLIGAKATPGKFLSQFFQGVFGTARRTWIFGRDTAMLLCLALAITPAFRMRFWNLGADGQALIGALASVFCMFFLGGRIPNGLLLVISLAASVVAGAVWALLPAIFKALWGTNESLFTLMMNYIATNLVMFSITKWFYPGKDSMKEMEHGHLPQLLNEYLLVILIVLALTTLMFIYLYHTKQGYEISVVGESENTARYVGINVGKVTMRTLLISGAICGLMGFLQVSAFDHSVTAQSIGGLGFTAIMVSWLAKFNPFIMIGTAALIAFLQRGGQQISTAFDVNDAIPNIFIGIILFFIIGCEFFINYQIKFRASQRTKGGSAK